MKRFRFVGLIGLLILIDQGIKLYIKHFLFDKNFNIVSDLVQFRPKLNDKYSWINSMLKLGISKTVHIISAIITILLIYIIYKFITTMYNRGRMIYIIFVFILSGSVCSIIDKIFWGGSLDYIYLKGLFIFDLKDVYLTIFEIGAISMLIINFKEFSKISNRKLFSDFKQFVKQICTTANS